MFRDSVKRWEPVVQNLINPILSSVILAIINNESRGRPGEIARAKTRYARALPSRPGGTVKTQKALGLMQVIPLVIADYNKTHKTIYYEDMTGTTGSDARKQIQIGVWTFNNVVKAIESYTKASLIQNNKINLDLLKLVLVGYAWGIGRLKNKLSTLRANGFNPTYSNLIDMYPDLGEPQNRPIYYTNKIIKKITGAPVETEKKNDFFIVAIGVFTIWKILKG